MRETLSVRLSARARQALAEAAPTHDAAGASALARDILEQWADQAIAERAREGARRVAGYIERHPNGWDDDPADFFRETPP